MVRICLFAALIAALGLLPRVDIPIAAGVPVTAQTLGVMLAGLLLGARAGVLSVLLFIGVVALGLPFLAGGRGGLGVFAGPTTGFLLGWIPGAFITGLFAVDRAKGHSWRGFLAAFVGALAGGILVVYACGIGWLILYGMSLKAATFATLIFLPGDLLKVMAAAWIATRFNPYPLRSPQ